MDYLKYLANRDKKRKQKKRIAINMLYVLVPVFLIASTFTNEIVIDKCEDIYEENTILLDSIAYIKANCKANDFEADSTLGLKNKEVQELEDKKRKLVAEMLSTSKKISTLEISMNDLKLNNRSKDDQIKNLEKEIELFKKLVKDHEIEEAILEDEITELLKDIETVAKERNNLLNQKAKLDTLLSMIKSKYKNASSEISSLNSDNKRLETEIANLKRTIAKRDATIKQLNSDNSNMNKQLQDLKNCNQRFTFNSIYKIPSNATNIKNVENYKNYKIEVCSTILYISGPPEIVK